MGEARRPGSYGGLRVLIAGGGVAGLEAMLALRELAGDLVDVDADGCVTELVDVYAAGDITRFPVKQGGIAAQQADAVAESIAARAGVDIVPSPFEPVVHALMLTGREPLYLRAEIPAGLAEASTDPLWWPPSKIAGRHLAPFLATLESDETYARSGRNVP